MPERTTGYGTTERRCARCRSWFGLVEFYARPNGRRGSYCSTCRTERRHEAPRRATRSTVGTFDRAFGVEIEFKGDAREVEIAVAAVGVSVVRETYNHQRRSYWKIVPDGSVVGGAELVSPPLHGAAGFAELTKVCDAVARVATVDRTTGLHVHMDASGETIESIRRFVEGYVSRQVEIDGLVSSSRRSDRSNGYCARWTESALDELRSIVSLRDLAGLFQADSNRRYRTVNVCSYARHGTVEVRQHQGSLNGAKITAWVRFLMALWTATDVAEGSVYGMLDGLAELDSPTREYLRSRAYAFQMAGSR